MIQNPSESPEPDPSGTFRRSGGLSPESPLTDRREVGAPTHAERKRHREHRALPGGTAEGHGAAVLLDDLVGDGQAESGTSGLGGEERIEDVRRLLRLDAASGIR